MKRKAYEVNFDGIVGPTHNYSGLSYGNIASINSKFNISNPKAAALQGLKKMKFLSDLGIKQAIIPPQERPYLPFLKDIGFRGSDADILKKAFLETPEVFIACCSAAAMWTANAATVCPSIDSIDKLVHITPANLSSKFHRSIESEATYIILKKIFKDHSRFIIHSPLPPGTYFADEGAANHNRFCKTYGEVGIQLFVYGKSTFKESRVLTKKYPARQCLEASEAIVRIHQIPSEKVLFARQNPKAIDEGVFHNDVISVANENVFFYHETAFEKTEEVTQEICDKVLKYCLAEMTLLKVSEKEVSLKDAVASYLFNSQIVTLEDGTMSMIAPFECSQTPSVKEFLTNLLKREQPIKSIHYINLHESMANGGGPACLRMRVVLNETELKSIHQGVLLDYQLYNKLEKWINCHYRDRLSINDLADPQLLEENRYALDELTKLLEMGSIYSFQR